MGDKDEEIGLARENKPVIRIRIKKKGRRRAAVLVISYPRTVLPLK